MRKTRWTHGLGAVVLGSLVAATSAYAQARTYVAKHNGWSRATFESDAPIESIVGVTSNVEGRIDVDPKKPLAAVKGAIAIDVASFNTGIKLRDEHLRSKMWLDAESHPKITFELLKVSSDAGELEYGKYVKGTAIGKITIKGETREVELPVRVGLFPIAEEMRKKMMTTADELLRVSARFRLKLSDYGVKIPAMLGMKVSDELKVRVDVSAVHM